MYYVKIIKDNDAATIGRITIRYRFSSGQTRHVCTMHPDHDPDWIARALNAYSAAPPPSVR